MSEPDLTSGSPMPTLYLGHGAPPLLDDPVWPGELAAWARSIRRPEAVLIVSAHWERAPLSIAATTIGSPRLRLLGLPRALLQAHLPLTRRTGAGGAGARADRSSPAGRRVTWPWARPRSLHPAHVHVAGADVPVLQISMPNLGAESLLETGRQLSPLRDEGVLIIGSGFLTHGLPFIDLSRPDDRPPAWSAEFDAWAAECVARRDFDALLDYRHRAPALEFAHPTVEHLVPLFVALGAVIDTPGSIDTTIEGFWLNLSKRSFQFN